MLFFNINELAMPAVPLANVVVANATKSLVIKKLFNMSHDLFKLFCTLNVLLSSLTCNIT